MTTQSRHYYAERSPYGSNTLSNADTLARFSSVAERRAWIEAQEQEHPGQWHPVTVAQVRHRYAISDFSRPDRHEPAQDGAPAYVHQRDEYII